MRRVRRWRLGLVLVMVAVGSCRESPSEPDGCALVYGVEGLTGGNATAEQLRATVAVVSRRLDVAGLSGVAVRLENDGRQLVATLPRSLTPKLDEIRDLTERPGTLEFRIEADRETEESERALQEKSGGLVRASDGYAWVPWARSGRPDVLVGTPERASLDELGRLDRQGVAHDAPQYVAAKKTFDEARRAEVFDGEQLASAGVVDVGFGPIVTFEFKRDRREPFREFTRRHLHQGLAIIIDGKVDAVPVIKSPLPGGGVLESGQRKSFTESEASDLAAVLTSGPLAVRLVHVRTETPK